MEEPIIVTHLFRSVSFPPLFKISTFIVVLFVSMAKSVKLQYKLCEKNMFIIVIWFILPRDQVNILHRPQKIVWEELANLVLSWELSVNQNWALCMNLLANLMQIKCWGGRS